MLPTAIHDRISAGLPNLVEQQLALVPEGQVPKVDAGPMNVEASRIVLDAVGDTVHPKRVEGVCCLQKPLCPSLGGPETRVVGFWPLAAWRVRDAAKDASREFPFLLCLDTEPALSPLHFDRMEHEVNRRLRAGGVGGGLRLWLCGRWPFPAGLSLFPLTVDQHLVHAMTEPVIDSPDKRQFLFLGLPK